MSETISAWKSGDDFQRIYTGDEYRFTDQVNVE